MVKFNDGTTENGVWEIAITGQDGTGQNQYVLRQKAGQYAPVGPVTLPPLRATNATSVSSADVTIPLTVTTNNAIDVAWTNTTLPEGNYGQTYTPVNLTAYVKSTLNNGTETVSDTYTFTLDSQKGSTNNDWAVSSAGIVTNTNTNGTVRDVGSSDTLCDCG